MSKSLHVSVRSAAPLETVWSLLGDATTWSSWARFSQSGYQEEGEGVHGVGAIRAFGTGPVKSAERIVAYDPPDHLAYELLKGLPVKGYRADVNLTRDGDGTLITWDSTWASAWPGVATVLRIVVKDVARSLAKGAESAG